METRCATQTAWALFVSSNYFSMAGVRPVAGQLVVGRANEVVPSVVIGERFWRRLHEPSLGGLTRRLNDITVAVSGIVRQVESLIVLTACVGPALRAARVDPLLALRSE